MATVSTALPTTALKRVTRGVVAGRDVADLARALDADGDSKLTFDEFARIVMRPLAGAATKTGAELAGAAAENKRVTIRQPVVQGVKLPVHCVALDMLQTKAQKLLRRVASETRGEFTVASSRRVVDVYRRASELRAKMKQHFHHATITAHMAGAGRGAASPMGSFATSFSASASPSATGSPVRFPT